MKKSKLLSKCCGAEVMENGGYRCIKCGKLCDIEEVQKLSKTNLTRGL